MKFIDLMVRECDDGCDAEYPHSHHLSWIGRIYYSRWNPLWRGVF